MNIAFSIVIIVFGVFFPESVLDAPGYAHEDARNDCDDAERVQAVLQLLLEENETSLPWSTNCGVKGVEEECASANAAALVGGLEEGHDC